jgi:hypothetical protein
VTAVLRAVTGFTAIHYLIPEAMHGFVDSILVHAIGEGACGPLLVLRVRMYKSRDDLLSLWLCLDEGNLG